MALTFRKLADKCLSPWGMRVISANRLKISQMQSINDFRAECSRRVAKSLDYKVIDGPFTGMTLPDNSSWNTGDDAAKLTGLYEQELYPFIEKLAAENPECIVNLGCAEGFYAIGMKMLVPSAHVYGYDISTDAKAAFSNACAINNVSATFWDYFEYSNCTIFEKFNSVLWIIDTEGDEVELVVIPDNIKNKSSFIIECHDFGNQNITSMLTNWLKPTHEVNIVTAGMRNPHTVSAFNTLSEVEKYLLVCEMRAASQHWLIASPKTAP